MAELHPAVQHMAEKGYEHASMDEMAIVNCMRRSLADSESYFRLIRQWLQQENPHSLKGPELSEWATGIAEWVLPTQMRSTTNAKESREQGGESNARVQSGNTEVKFRGESNQTLASESHRHVGAAASPVGEGPRGETWPLTDVPSASGTDTSSRPI